VLVNENGFALLGERNLRRLVQINLNALRLLVETLFDALHVLRDWVDREKLVGLAGIVLLGVLQELILEALLVDLEVLALGCRIILVQAKFDVAVDDARD
jgi:hypothetical protein